MTATPCPPELGCKPWKPAESVHSWGCPNHPQSADDRAGWRRLPLVLPHGYAELWVCPICSAAVLDPDQHMKVLPHPWPTPVEAVDDRHTPDEWAELAGFRIVDPDGWRGPAGRDFTDRITRGEFDRRAAMSTIDRSPR